MMETVHGLRFASTDGLTNKEPQRFHAAAQAIQIQQVVSRPGTASCRCLPLPPGADEDVPVAAIEQVRHDDFAAAARGVNEKAIAHIQSCVVHT